MQLWLNKIFAKKTVHDQNRFHFQTFLAVAMIIVAAATFIKVANPPITVTNLFMPTYTSTCQPKNRTNKYA